MDGVDVPINGYRAPQTNAYLLSSMSNIISLTAMKAMVSII
jgi:hypothetical protein